MNCAGYSYKRFGQQSYKSRASPFWCAKIYGKNFFYKLFTTMLRPFAGLNCAASSFTQPTQDEEDKQRYTLELITLPMSQLALRQFQRMNQSKWRQQDELLTNQFAYQEGLSGLNETNQHDAGVFNQLQCKNTGSFVHSVEAIQNAMMMDTFCLDEVETVMSEYDILDEDCQSCMSESMVLSELDNFYETSTEDCTSNEGSENNILSGLC